MTTFRHFDLKRDNGVTINFELVRLGDDCVSDPKDRDEGMTEEREQAYYRNEWSYIGVQARAVITVVRNGVGTIYTLESAGLFGIESDCDEYIQEVFEEQKVELLDDIKSIGRTLNSVAE